jgi:hypothetical protein
MCALGTRGTLRHWARAGALGGAGALGVYWGTGGTGAALAMRWGTGDALGALDVC